MKEHDEDKKEPLSGVDDLLSGRGSPAFMSAKEPAIRLLRERYSESFAITADASRGQTYLFLIKTGLWALVSTFTKRDYNGDSLSFGVSETLEIIQSAIEGRDSPALSRIDACVKNALERVQRKVAEFKLDH